MQAPIELKFYTDEDEVEKTFSRNRVPTYLLDTAIELQKTLGENEEVVTQEKIDLLYDFIIDFYNKKFTREELKQKTDLVECMSIVGQILGRAGQLAKQFASQNPTHPSSKKK